MKIWLSKDEIRSIYEKSLKNFPELRNTNITLKFQFFACPAIRYRKATLVDRFDVLLRFFALLILYALSLWASLGNVFGFAPTCLLFFSILFPPFLERYLYIVLYQYDPSLGFVLVFPQFINFWSVSSSFAMHHELAHVFLYEHDRESWKNERVVSKVATERMKSESLLVPIK